MSQNIEAFRLQKKLTQNDMAEKLSVTEQTVSDWESGESEPDIETLAKIADVLNTEIEALVYGPQDPAHQKKEKRHLLFVIVGLLILGIFFYFFGPFAAKLEKETFISGPYVLLKLFLLPIFWLVFGWAMMQALGILGLAKPSGARFAKAIHIAALVVVLLYAALMLPFIAETTKCMIQALQYHQNPALFPNGIQYDYNIPLFIQRIEMVLMKVTYSQPMLFILPSIILWLTKPFKKKQHE